MQMTVRSTNKMVRINGVPGRVWEGESKEGVKLSCVVWQVAIAEDAPSAEFDHELNEVHTRSTDRAFPREMTV